MPQGNSLLTQIANPYIPQVADWYKAERGAANDAYTDLTRNQAQQDRSALLEVGKIAAAGDIRGAQKKAYATGQFDQAKAFEESLAKAEDRGVQRAERLNKRIGQMAFAADTPEKWTSFIESARRQGLPDVDRYADFATRDQLMAKSSDYSTLLTAELSRRKLDQPVVNKFKSDEGIALTDKKGSTTILREPGQEGTTDTKNYQYDQRDRAARGLPEQSFSQWYGDKQKAAAPKNYETEEAKALGKAAAERQNNMAVAANKASLNLQQIKALETLFADGQSGRLANTSASVGAWADALGLSRSMLPKLGLDPKAADRVPAQQTIINNMALAKIGGEGIPSNNFSDADRQFLLETVARVQNTPMSNRIILEMAKVDAELSMRKAAAWREMRRTGMDFADFEDEWRSTVEREGVLRKRLSTVLQSTPQVRDEQAGEFTQPQRAAPQAMPGNPRYREIDASTLPEGAVAVGEDGYRYIKRNGRMTRVGDE